MSLAMATAMQPFPVNKFYSSILKKKVDWNNCLAVYSLHYLCGALGSKEIQQY